MSVHKRVLALKQSSFYCGFNGNYYCLKSKVKMQRYNIALLPTDNALQDKIVRISRSYFLDIHDEYILGTDEGLAHITLCQYKASSLHEALHVYHDFLSSETVSSIKLTIEKFHTRPGKLVNAGKFIAEYKIYPSPELIDLQLRCAERLEVHNLSSLTPSAGYSPHITLARLSEMPNKTPTNQDLACPIDTAGHIALGLSTEAGVFLKELIDRSETNN